MARTPEAGTRRSKMFPGVRPRVIVTRYRKRPLSLPDGTILRWGDCVALLQHDDGAPTGSGRSTRSARVVDPAARGVVHQSLRELAQLLSGNLALKDVRAVGILVDARCGREHRRVSAIAPCRRLWARVVTREAVRTRESAAR
jgi:hypothetical protein